MIVCSAGHGEDLAVVVLAFVLGLALAFEVFFRCDEGFRLHCLAAPPGSWLHAASDRALYVFVSPVIPDGHAPRLLQRALHGAVARENKKGDCFATRLPVFGWKIGGLLVSCIIKKRAALSTF